MAASQAKIGKVRAQPYRIPSDKAEADGTFKWDSTTLVLVSVRVDGTQGLGYTYSDSSIVGLIEGALQKGIENCDALDVLGCFRSMQQAVRNLGREGLAATAISAVDVALWDLTAKLLKLPLAMLLGHYRDAVPIYGSGGFTTYTDVELREQLRDWVDEDRCRWVKMKVGSEPSRDPQRVEVVREAICDHGLFVDANGAYSHREASGLAQIFAQNQVLWFEEPVSSDNLVGLRLVRDRAPPAMEVAAGEYGYTSDYFRRMLESGAIDVQQADLSRRGGVTGFLQVAALCEAHHSELSAHCAPALQMRAACAAPRFRHQEWFHDHVLIDELLFEGAPVPKGGVIRPDLSRPGPGLEFKESDAEPHRL